MRWETATSTSNNEVYHLYKDDKKILTLVCLLIFEQVKVFYPTYKSADYPTNASANGTWRSSLVIRLATRNRI
jgi:hypothetical protein